MGIQSVDNVRIKWPLQLDLQCLFCNNFEWYIVPRFCSVSHETSFVVPCPCFAPVSYAVPLFFKTKIPRD